MRRSLWLPVLFAAAVLIILAAAATWTVWRLERSLERELGERLEAVAAATAAVIDPGDLLEYQIEGTEGLAYGRLLVELEEQTASDGQFQTRCEAFMEML